MSATTTSPPTASEQAVTIHSSLKAPLTHKSIQLLLFDTMCVSDLNGPTHAVPTKDLPPVVKGSRDWRKFRPLQLPNGITCVLVNDKESKTTSCAVSVGCGASADPRELSGLAHFTEHMSFLGSKAYPKENEFKEYLSSHGGRSNASTSMSQTLYFFDIVADHAETAIDIFSNFFVEPLFSQSGTNREVNAVDSENSKNESNDGRRRLQILKALADQSHHYSKFSTGNIKTLPAVDTEGGGDDEKAAFVRQALLAFHRRHYRPDNMAVVVVGPQDLDVLEDWIVPRFAKIDEKQWGNNDGDSDEMSDAEKLVDAAAKDLPPDSYGSPAVPFNPAFKPEIQHGNWPVKLTTKPLQSMRKLFLYFPLPSTQDLGDQSPYALISHLLGHEGPGSCFAALQDAELIDTLSAGPRLADADQSLMQISISLTEKGEDNWEDVVNVIFKYCQLLHELAQSAKDGDQDQLETFRRIWDEICTLRELSFHQSSPSQAYSFSRALANNVRKIGTEHCISRGSLLNESKESLPLDSFLEFMKQIKPSKCIIEHCSKSAWKKIEETDKSNTDPSSQNDNMFGFQDEKWYGVNYHLTPVIKDTVDSWDRNVSSEEGCITVNKFKLYLPQVNNHISRDLSLCSDLPEDAKAQICKEMEPPNLLVQNDFGRLWHRLDDRYCLPKSVISILIRNPEIEHTFSQNEWTYDTKSSLQSTILINVFTDALAQQFYDAELAGLRWNMRKTSSGLILSFSGYSSANNKNLIDFALNIINHFFASHDKANDSFIKDSYFRTNKDYTLRNLKSYMESKRADTYAMYYTDLLMSSQGGDTAYKANVTESITVDSLKDHHGRIIASDAEVDCMFAGNVSEKDARLFYDRAQEAISRERTTPMHKSTKWIPGPIERRLETGEEIELHFQSQNKEEQNGSVLITYQSSIPSFIGRNLSKDESLLQSAAVRTICHMLREPLFNQLRTKEQLGYIVSSFYDRSVSSTFDASTEDIVSVRTVGIDSIAVKVVSKKLPPPVITKRIDEFLGTFRERLRNLSVEDLESHTSALSETLLKPTTNLNAEVRARMGKVTLYAPAIIKNGCMDGDIPWDSGKDLAESIKKLNSDDLLKAWDRIVAGKNRSRISSYVYGSSFPLSKVDDFQTRNNGQVIKLHSLDEIYKKRKALSNYSDNNVERARILPLKRALKNKLGLAGVVGASCLMFYTMYALGGSKNSTSEGGNGDTRNAKS